MTTIPFSFLSRISATFFHFLHFSFTIVSFQDEQLKVVQTFHLALKPLICMLSQVLIRSEGLHASCTRWFLFRLLEFFFIHFTLRLMHLELICPFLLSTVTTCVLQVSIARVSFKLLWTLPLANSGLWTLPLADCGLCMLCQVLLSSEGALA